MRFHYGRIPDEFDPDASWKPIWEPGPLLLQVVAVPMAIGMMAGLLFAWQCVADLSALVLGETELVILLVVILVSLPGIILIHELVHAMVHPHWGLSARTIVGIWPQKFLFYAHFSGPLSCIRFLAVFAMPLLVISIMPLALAAVFRLPDSVKVAAMCCSVWNGTCASGDVIAMVLILSQIPIRAIVQNKGWETYWKPAG